MGNLIRNVEVFKAFGSYMCFVEEMSISIDFLIDKQKYDHKFYYFFA